MMRASSKEQRGTVSALPQKDGFDGRPRYGVSGMKRKLFESATASDHRITVNNRSENIRITLKNR
jgi:hypothetical protein